jgi:hypothetical protein
VLAQRAHNALKHPGYVFGHFVIPEPQDSVAFVPQKCIAPLIAARLLRKAMLASVELDDNSRAMLHEIEDVVPERRLPAEVMAESLQLAQLAPQPAFVLGRVCTQLPSSGDVVAAGFQSHPLQGYRRTPPTRKMLRIFRPPHKGEVDDPAKSKITSSNACRSSRRRV